VSDTRRIAAGAVLAKAGLLRIRYRWHELAGLILLVLPLASGKAAELAGISAHQIHSITELASAASTRDRLPGLAIAVAKNGHIWSAGFGKADLEQDVPVDSRSMFRTASVGKWFTATAAMRLVEQGKLDLDVPIQRYCPQFTVKPWSISTRQLLTHMSGIRHYYGQNGEKLDTESDRKALEEPMRREQATQYLRYLDVIQPLDAFKNDSLLFEPGTRTHYSSLGYRVVGCVLQGAAQKPYRELMHDLVFVPAGMATITEDDSLAVIPHRVAGYSRAPDGKMVRAAFRDVSANLPAGGWLSTVGDLARFAVAFGTGKLVDAATRDQMVEHPKLNNGMPAPNPFGTPGYYYGIGVMVDPGPTQPAWFHTGGQSGVSTLLFWFPADSIAVAVMTNMDGSAVRESLARKIAEIVRDN
jgi:CubicO group peptidase (beta-lactamase class C family)